MFHKRYFPSPKLRRDSLGKLWIDGEFYMGRNRVPPMPITMALVDRVTGATGVLSFTGTVPSLSISIIPVTSAMRDVHVYGKQEGPYSGAYRLFLSNGVLAFEKVVGNVTYSSPRILTRRSFETTVLEITVNPANGAVVYTQVSLG